MPIRSILIAEGLVAAVPPSAWDVEGTKAELSQIPGVEVKHILRDAFGSVPHFRLTVPNFKTAIMVYPSASFPSLFIAVDAAKKMRNAPPTMMVKNSLATPQAVRALVEKWMDAYIKMNPTSEPKAPSVGRVLDNVYYGRPLPK